MHNFHYFAPKTLTQLTDLLAKHRANASLLAGGTDLIIAMRTGQIKPEAVIDVKHVPELKRLSLSDSELSLGAAASCRSIYENEKVIEAFPILSDCASLVGSKQVQGRASIGGNLCNASPSADTIPSLLVLNAVAYILGPNGERQVPIRDFCTAPRQTVLQDDEILVRILIPVPPPHTNARFLRFIPRNEMDIAVANSASCVTLSADFKTFVSAAVALGAVGPTPLYVQKVGDYLAGKSVSEEHIDKAASIAREAARPIDDMRGCISQRKHLVEVLTKRTLKGAIARVRGYE